MQPLGTVNLRNVVFFAHHGVMREEQHTGGRYEVDVSMDLRFDEAARRDSLQLTVDYEKVYRMVNKVVTTSRCHLLERLAYLIAHQVMDAFPVVERIAVTVRKANPPIGGTSDAVDAVYRAVR